MTFAPAHASSPRSRPHATERSSTNKNKPTFSLISNTAAARCTASRVRISHVVRSVILRPPGLCDVVVIRRIARIPRPRIKTDDDDVSVTIAAIAPGGFVRATHRPSSSSCVVWGARSRVVLFLFAPKVCKTLIICGLTNTRDMNYNVRVLCRTVIQI